MDPFQEYTLQLYNSLKTSTEIPNLTGEHKKWWLLSCEMLLKEHNLDEAVYIRALEIVESLIDKEMTENNWIFVIDCVRKGIKRLDKGRKIKVIDNLLKTIHENSTNFHCKDHFLKLILLCAEKNISFEYNLDNLYAEYFGGELDKVDFNEFYFIKTESIEVTLRQRCQRLLLLINPVRVKLPINYCFELFSVSDSELIKYMIRLFSLDQERFFKFYKQIIKKRFLSVDFFIEELLTDPVDLLELLLNIFSSDPPGRAGKDFKNFHTLLLLKLEMGRRELFPFDCEILIRKLSLFLDKIR